MITIFTPTYNREKYLEKLYNSLVKQTDKNFVWLVIDDGSKDGTEETIKRIIAEKKINVEYFKQENQGKHIAYNVACDMCKTEYMLCLDSDDTLSENAVAVLENFTRQLDDTIWAIIGPRVHEDGNLQSPWVVPKDEKIKMQDIYQKYGYVGETYILMNMKIATKYRFPKFDNEKLVPENVIYDKMDDKYYILAKDEKIYISDYQPDGYSKNQLRTFAKSLKGTCYANLVKANSQSANLKIKILSYARYSAIKRVFKLKNEKLIDLTDKKIKILTLPLSVVMYIKYYAKKVKINRGNYDKN